jgi:hypothetical protein
MNLSIDNKKLKIKYILGNYKELVTWPNAEDVMYLIVQWAMSSDEDHTFTDVFLEKKFGIPPDKLTHIVASLMADGYIIKQKTTNTKTVFSIGKNPFA